MIVLRYPRCISWNRKAKSFRYSNFFQMTRNQFEIAIKWFRSDNAKDYFNQTLSSFFNEHGIIHESSCVHTPQQNGVAEQKIGHLLAVNRASLFHTNVPKQYWGEVVLTAAYLVNYLRSQTLQNSSLIQLFSKFYPHFKTSNNLVPRIFGCVLCPRSFSSSRKTWSLIYQLHICRLLPYPKGIQVLSSSHKLCVYWCHFCWNWIFLFPTLSSEGELTHGR